MRKGVALAGFVLLLAMFVLTGCPGHRGRVESEGGQIQPAGGGSTDEPMEAKTDRNAMLKDGGPDSGDLDGASLSGLQPVFFDFDQSEIRSDQVPALEGNAALLKQNVNLRVTIEGHCDERGTEEYNLALGASRAGATREYLIRLGVDPSRMGAISYGENNPFADGHNEQAWRENRRAHVTNTPPQ